MQELAKAKEEAAAGEGSTDVAVTIATPSQADRGRVRRKSTVEL